MPLEKKKKRQQTDCVVSTNNEDTRAETRVDASKGVARGSVWLVECQRTSIKRKRKKKYNNILWERKN